MFGDAPEWFGVVLWLSPSMDKCSGGNSSISIFGSGSSGGLLFFWKGGMKKIFYSSGPQLCMIKNIHETYHWKAL